MSFFDDTEIFKFSGSLYVLNDDYIKLNTEKCRLEEENEGLKVNLDICNAELAQYCS